MKYKIKWESNRKVEKNSKIKSNDIVKSLPRCLRKRGIAGVRLHDMRKKYPSASIFFSGVNSSHSNKDKAHTHYPSLIAHVDANPNSLAVEFSSSCRKVENTWELWKVINEVIKTIQWQKERKRVGKKAIPSGQE